MPSNGTSPVRSLGAGGSASDSPQAAGFSVDPLAALPPERRAWTALPGEGRGVQACRPIHGSRLGRMMRPVAGLE